MSRIGTLFKLYQGILDRVEQIRGFRRRPFREQPLIQVDTVFNFRLFGPAANGLLYPAWHSNLLIAPYEPMVTFLTLVATVGGGTYFDIGANLGYFSLLAACNAQEPIAVHAFEPVSVFYDLLVQNIELNQQADRVTSYHLGLGDVEAERTIFIEDTGVASSLLPGYVESRAKSPPSETEIVRVKPLDDLVEPKGLREPFVYKIDVEGYEWEVIQGAERLIRHPASACILAEIYDPKTNPNALKTLQTLEEWGFRCYGVAQATPLTEQDTSDNRLIAFEVVPRDDPRLWTYEWLCLREGHSLSNSILGSLALYPCFLHTRFLTDTELERVLVRFHRVSRVAKGGGNRGR